MARDKSTVDEIKAFEAIVEDGLDEVMEQEEREVAAETAKTVKKTEAQEKWDQEVARDTDSTIAGKVDPAVIRNRQRAFKQRKEAMEAHLPLARMRRGLRWVGALLLIGVLGTAYFGRVQVVEQFPAMAGLYQSVGLGVNVVGLDFSDVTTLHTTRDGKDLLIVSAQIVGLMPDPVHVPAVVVTLLGADGNSLYEWSVVPAVRDLMGGERATFNTQLALPPGPAERVRLSFANGQKQRTTTTDGAVTAKAVDPVAQSAPPDHSSPEHH
ncbi:hypothetical protein [Devosia sp. 2618]|uniref:hypothetical protein n=1 Tax=Devosia sp. 2618 TaxID=3156454 RepID=UPI003396BB42